MSKLTWKRDTMGYAGTIWVAAIYDLRDAVEGVEKGYRWELQGLRVKWLEFKTMGTLKTLGGAQRAAQRAWDQWLEAAGVVEIAPSTGHPAPSTAECPTKGASDARS